MKSSLGKLKRIAMNKSEPKDNWDHHISVHIDGLTQAAKDMKEMRTCYDSLLSAAAATANSAYEFSESLLEMGSFLLDKTAIPDNGESGGTLSLLGRVQLELRKLVDTYRSHIVMTITNPSESLLSELRKVEEMKLQCYEKREMFEYMVGQRKEKGKLRHGKGETFTSKQVQTVYEEYDEAARLCVFRVESLKQGQCRSLLTQAARHHSAQLNFFRRGLQSLEAVEPHVKNVAEEQHIGYELSELNDGEGNNFEVNDDSELSFDYRQSKQELENASTLRNSMEVSTSNLQASRMKDVEAQPNTGRNIEEMIQGQQSQAGSYSAPLNAEKFDPAERIKEMQTNVQKLNAHVLPTPAEAKGPRLSTAPGKSSKSLWHSSPLDTEKQKKFLEDQLSAQHTISKSAIGVKENRGNYILPRPEPLSEGASVAQLDAQNQYDNQKMKQLAFSGPVTSKSASDKFQSSGPNPPQSLSVSHNTTTAPFLSSPKISELHELPRPPGSLVSILTRSSGVHGHSAPLVDKIREVSPTHRNPLWSSKQVSPLPRPRLSLSQSFSVRSSTHSSVASHAGKVLQSSAIAHNMEESTSPPLTPISLSRMKSLNAGQNMR